MKNVNNKKREMFVFVGQNASCGNSNPITGRTDTFGTVYRVVGTLKQAREWAEYKDDGYAQTIIAVGGRRKMREFCLGQTMHSFNAYLDYAPCVYPDNEENSENWNIG